MEREDAVLCKQALKNGFLLSLKGLGHEGAALAREAGMLDPRFSQRSNKRGHKKSSHGGKQEGGTQGIRQPGSARIHEGLVFTGRQSVDESPGKRCKGGKSEL